MKFDREYFKLILPGSKNVPTMINAIIRATIQAQEDSKKEDLTFRQVHIFHTEESLHALSTSTSWQEALNYYKISSTTLVHHVTKIEDSNSDRFEDLAEQLRTIVNPLDNAQYYIDVTSGISALKSILAVFAYVLDIKNVYSLEISFTDNKQRNLFYHQLKKCNLKIEYRKFPPIREFDFFGKFNYVEILRYHSIIDELIKSLKPLSPNDFDFEHLRESLLSGVHSRLIGEATEESYSYRHSIFASCAGIEEVANIVLTLISNQNKSWENLTLGPKLDQIHQFFSRHPKYFINAETLGFLTKLITSVRNEMAHPSKKNNYSKEILDIQSRLSSQLAFAFLQFTTKAINAFRNRNGEIIKVKELDTPHEEDKTIFYFGFDGDSTGDYLDIGFKQSSEEIVRQRSQNIYKTIEELRKLIYKETKDHSSVIFAEGDNILFKARYQVSLLNKLQKIYKDKTGLTATIGYAKTLREVSLAMRLSKAKGGDSIMGIALMNSEDISSIESKLD